MHTSTNLQKCNRNTNKPLTPNVQRTTKTIHLRVYLSDFSFIFVWLLYILNKEFHGLLLSLLENSTIIT